MVILIVCVYVCLEGEPQPPVLNLDHYLLQPVRPQSTENHSTNSEHGNNNNNNKTIE